MRIAQYKILNQVLSNFELPSYIWAFERGKSIPEMCKMHVKKRFIISIDISDFFTSIKESGVRAIFEEHGVSALVSRTLSELCTYKSFVPQGALTSPRLSNIVSACTFGPAIESYCQENGLALSLYADDVTISSDKVFENRDEQREFISQTIALISNSLSEYGFQVNRSKTKVMYPHQRNYVCGAVTNEKVSLRKTERNKLRAITHNCLLNGVSAEAEKSHLPVEKFSSVILGRLNWYASLDPIKGKPLKEQFKALVKEEKSVDADKVFARIDSLYSN